MSVLPPQWDSLYWQEVIFILKQCLNGYVPCIDGLVQDCGASIADTLEFQPVLH